MAVLWSLTRAAVQLPLFQDNGISYCIPQKVKCRTDAFNNLLRSLKIILSKLKHVKISESVIPQ